MDICITAIQTIKKLFIETCTWSGIGMSTTLLSQNCLLHPFTQSLTTPPASHPQCLRHTFMHYGKCSSTERHDFLNRWSLKVFGTTTLFGRFQLWILGWNIFYCTWSLHHSRLCCLWAFALTAHLSLLTPFPPVQSHLTFRIHPLKA